MTNRDIDDFFSELDLGSEVDKVVRPPNEMWQFHAGLFPVTIQTQESANRMRVVVFIAEERKMEPSHLSTMLEANYHTALDARYALTDGYVVSAFIHPFQELDSTQFVMGLYQAIHCAETFGDSYSGGTMVFGPSSGSENDTGPMESGVNELMSEIADKIRK